MSYSDGVNSTGRLLFYLTALDATAQDLEVLQSDAACKRECKCRTPGLINAALLAQVDSRATLTVGEIQVEGSCGVMDPEVSRLLLFHDMMVVLKVEASWLCMQDPTCAKVSISGRMGVVPAEGLEEAEDMLFQRHPQMRDWPVSFSGAFRMAAKGRGRPDAPAILCRRATTSGCMSWRWRLRGCWISTAALRLWPPGSTTMYSCGPGRELERCSRPDTVLLMILYLTSIEGARLGHQKPAVGGIRNHDLLVRSQTI